MFVLSGPIVSSQGGRVLLRARKAEPTELIQRVVPIPGMRRGTEEDAGRSSYQDILICSPKMPAPLQVLRAGVSCKNLR